MATLPPAPPSPMAPLRVVPPAAGVGNVTVVGFPAPAGALWAGAGLWRAPTPRDVLMVGRAAPLSSTTPGRAEYRGRRDPRAKGRGAGLRVPPILGAVVDVASVPLPRTVKLLIVKL